MKRLYIFLGFCLLVPLVWVFNPTYETPYERYQKLRYEGKFNLAIGNYFEAGEQLYQAMEIAEKEIFYINHQLGKSTNRFKDLDVNEISNVETRELAQRMDVMKDSFLDKESLLEVYLSLAYVMYQLGAYSRMPEFLDIARKEFPENKFVPLFQSLYYNLIKDNEKQLFSLNEAKKIKPSSYVNRNKYKIYKMIITEVTNKVTSMSQVDKILKN